MNDHATHATPPALNGDHPEPPVRRRGGATRWILIVVGVAIVGVIAWYLKTHIGQSEQQTAAKPGASGDARPVPVILAVAEKKDVPIYLEGLGNATPLQTVSVKSQVDGRLDKVMFVEGKKVKKGEQIAQVDPRPFMIQLHTAEAALARDNATLRNAKLNLDRYKTLRQQNLIPQQQVDDQATAVDTAQAAVMADSAQAENARLMLDYARVVSPIDGVTGVRQVDPGNLVHANDANGIVIITQIDPMAVLFTLPEDDLPKISEELAKGKITVDAFSRDGNRKLATGTLALVDNQINAQTATIRLKATFDNPDGALWPGEFVKARLLLKTRAGATVIPAAAVQRGPQGTFAYVVGEDETATMRPIEIDTTQGDLAIVAKGLEPGEKVVADGQNQLRPGSKVVARDRRAGPAGSASGAPPPGSGQAAPPVGSGQPGERGPGSGGGQGRRRGGGP